MKKETIGILICMLLIATAVAPVINASTGDINEVKEPTDTFGLIDTDEWEGIIDDIIIRFEGAETQESKIGILEEIPIVMDTYDLLPEDMTVGEAQELIVTSYLEAMSSSSPQTEQSNFAIDSPPAVSKNVLLSTLPQLQISESNRINSIKLDPPQPAPWPPDDKIIKKGFGVISNPERYMSEWYPVWFFNCENVRGRICDDDDSWCYWHHYTDGELRCILGDPAIITDHFMYTPILHHFYLIVK